MPWNWSQAGEQGMWPGTDIEGAGDGEAGK